MPCVAEVARRWARHLKGPVSILTDDQKPLTDERLGVLADALRVTQGATPSSRIKGIALPHLLRGSSEQHPSIQLADLFAGATASIAARHAGTSSPAADDLLQVVLPLVENESLLPYDSAETLAQAGVGGAG
ncbi:hypothetical protein [Streptomyces venezuelae]|uniref:hypothetical protein n=1 Tax=Streptomyces venezuelae TaxID=54571 RepID=UPI001238BEE7|nr:hypothetical protein [Streptomyces venezuelae]